MDGLLSLDSSCEGAARILHVPLRRVHLPPLLHVPLRRVHLPPLLQVPLRRVHLPPLLHFPLRRVHLPPLLHFPLRRVHVPSFLHAPLRRVHHLPAPAAADVSTEVSYDEDPLSFSSPNLSADRG